MNRADWLPKRRCNLDNAAYFYPYDSDDYDPARAICGGCPVRERCLADALREEGNSGVSARHGFRGGKTPEERHTIAKGVRSKAKK